MKNRVLLLLCLLVLCGFTVNAHAQEVASKAQTDANARKVTITLVRWPYT